MRRHGQIRIIGVESTGSFGVILTRALTKAGERVAEVNRPNRLARRMDGKSDRLDAEQIARAVLGQTSTAIPKAKSGTVEVIRTLRVNRASAVKARTQAFNTLWGIMIGAPSPLRDKLVVAGASRTAGSDVAAVAGRGSCCRSRGRCSKPATTPTASTPRQPSPNSAALR
jgi:transposase